MSATYEEVNSLLGSLLIRLDNFSTHRSEWISACMQSSVTHCMQGRVDFSDLGDLPFLYLGTS